MTWSVETGTYSIMHSYFENISSWYKRIHGIHDVQECKNIQLFYDMDEFFRSDKKYK